jgi:hypothetical protein
MRLFIRPLLIIVAGFALQAKSIAQPKTVRALFLGNSYVTANSLPLLIKSAAASAGDTLIYAENCPGGYAFSDHLNNPVSLARMEEPQWDYVIIQQQSILGSAVCNDPYNIAPNAFEPNNVLSVSDLKALIDQEGGIPMLYMTWGRKNGLASFCNQFPQAGYYCTYRGMDSLLQHNYLQMAGPNMYFQERLPLAAVGAVWRFVRENHPEIELYNSDESHPSMAGSYLAACTFYNMLFRKSAQGIGFNPGLPADAAAKIRMAVHEVVNNNLQKWNMGYYDPAPDFIIESIDPAARKVSFKNESNKLPLFGSYHYQNFKRYKYRWSFGDGNFSNEVNPSHTFGASGVYTVKLYAAYKNGSFLDSVSRIVRIGGPLISVRGVAADETETQLTADDSLQFQSTLAGDTLSRTIHVYNQGTQPLSISQIVLDGATGWSYVLDRNAVDPGGRAVLTIRFHPGAGGAYSSTLRIVSNDGHTGTFPLRLFGKGIGAVRAYEVYRNRVVFPDGGLIDYGRPPLLQENEVLLEMKNTGNLPLQINAVYLTGDVDAFYVAARPQLLNPNNSSSLPLICRVADTQSRTAYLHVATNNPDRPVYRAKLTVFEKNLGEETLSIYPNPVADVLNVTLRNNRIAGYALYDMNGRLLANKRVAPTYLLTIKPPVLSSGTYIIRVTSETGKNYAGKVIKLND